MLYTGKIISMINLTQHNSTSLQKEQGVFEPPNKDVVKDLITFEEPPTLSELRTRASKCVDLCRESNALHAMVAGAPYWLVVLEFYLRLHNITPLHSFSKRVVYDHENTDGSVDSVKTFIHAAWIQSPEYTLTWT